MPQYTPKENHPWRNYGNRPKVKTNGHTEPKVAIKKLRLFLTEIVESWETMEIEVEHGGGIEKRYLGEIPDSKVAAWLANLIKSSYVPKRYVD